ncbi:MAG TPA: malate synthase A [Bryobacteraceae bacterium]|nr:malate synthase A [Bryobacteraceae bacterium]
MSTSTGTVGAGLQVTAPVSEHDREILTPEALRFVEELSRRFEARRRELLQAREDRRERLRRGELPDFLESTRHIREAKWTVAAIPGPLLDRRVEITGPVDRKMIINALNSGASMFMADFEDSNSPTWRNNVEGQLNLRDAVRRSITFESPEGRQYRLNERTAVLLVRPRGWHLVEKHARSDGQPVSGSLFDFGLFFFHNAKALLERGWGPYLYLPKLESHLEARLWNDIFVFAQDYVGVPQGSIRATVLIETILGAFEMDEILHELRDHSSGLNCGRWDYIFSFIKKLGHRPEMVLPDRAQVTMDRAFLKTYVDLLIQTCHKREIHAMGGMAAQIPIKNDAQANERALEKVRQDKLREVKAGHDGTWVAHPGLVPIAKEMFDQHMPTPNQIHVKRQEVRVTRDDLLRPHTGDITAEGLRVNVDVGIQYLEAWLNGNGCVPIYNLMEDAATAEISRSQVWQWVRHGVKLADGRSVTPELVREAIARELQDKPGTPNKKVAAQLFESMMTRAGFEEFLTIPAYEHID